MRIVFLTLLYPTEKANRNLYADLMDELSSLGHNVIVYSPDETRWHGKVKKSFRLGVTVYGIPTGRVTKAPLLLKTVNLLILAGRYTRAVRKNGEIGIDLLIYSTPPLTFLKAIRSIKRDSDCMTYLLLKDIFPQNAVDLGLMRVKGLAWRYFRWIEKALYRVSDHIGCMSNANIQYLLSNNIEIPPSKVHECPNSIRPSIVVRDKREAPPVMSASPIPDTRLQLVYGGNLGKPQGIEFIVQALKSIEDLHGVYSTIVGSGTEYSRIKELLRRANIRKVTLIGELPKQEYLRLLESKDVGLIFLDSNFTIPNFPSRVLDYLDYGMPVIACTDSVSDLGPLLQEQGAGIACQSDDPTSFRAAVERLAADRDLVLSMGINARKLLENEYDVAVVARKLLDQLGPWQG